MLMLMLMLLLLLLLSLLLSGETFANFLLSSVCQFLLHTVSRPPFVENTQSFDEETVEEEKMTMKMKLENWKMKTSSQTR